MGVNGEGEFDADFQEEDESFLPLNEMSPDSLTHNLNGMSTN